MPIELPPVLRRRLGLALLVPYGTGGDVEKPNLAGQKSIYLRQQLEAFRAGRRKHPEMKSIARELTDREIDQLVVYYSTLAPR